MKIEEIRTSFMVYVIASQLQNLDGVTESLKLAGYMVATFSEITQAFSEFFSNPPHFLLFDGQEKLFQLEKAIAQVTEQLPESHVFVVSPVTERAKVIPLLDQGVYDLILTPLGSPTELVRALDRAAERDYFMYLNERLMEASQDAASASASPTSTEPVDSPSPSDEGLGDFHLSYVKDLFKGTTFEDIMQTFLAATSQAMGACPALFFKYIANRRVLLATLSERFENEEFNNLGLNLNESAPNFRAGQLRDPHSIKPLTDMIEEVFQTKQFFLTSVESLGEARGVACFLAPPPAEELKGYILDWKALLEKALSLLEAEKRLHVVTTLDHHTEVLNRPTFVQKISEEISRSRRTKMPLSMLSIALDQFGQLSSKAGQEEAILALRTAARILLKHSRVNDILGRTGVDEFGLLLPHTDREGAAVKAERLRRMIESADFSKVLNQFPKLTISLGVSEYPSVVRDAEELMQSADEALFQIRKTGNKTCVGNAPAGHQPDFKVELD